MRLSAFFLRSALAVLVAWLLVGEVIHYIFWVIPLLFVAITGSVLFVVQAFRALASRAWKGIVEPAALIVVLLLSLFSPLRFTGVYVRFIAERPKYETVVQDIEAGREQCDAGCILEGNDPIQVAFPWHGAADNWYGVCYDPTGRILQANRLNRDYSNLDDPQYEEVGGMYGCCLRGARHLRGSWYFCNFT